MSRLLSGFKGKSSKILQESKTYRYVLCFLVVVATFALIAVGLLPQKYFLEEGQVSPDTIFAPRTVVDPYLTKLAEDDVLANVADIYNHDQAISNESLNGLRSIQQTIERIAQEEDEEKREILLEEIPETLRTPAIYALLEFPAPTRELLFSKSYQSLQKILNQGLKTDGRESAKQQLQEEISELSTDIEVTQYIYDLTSNFLRVNLIFSSEATERERREALRQVEEIKILKDSKIIDKGEVVSEHHIKQLEALGLQTTSSQDFAYYFGLLILTTLVLVCVGIFLYLYHPVIYFNSHKLLLLGIVFLITLLLAKAFSFFSPFLIPITLAPILITILFTKGLATIITISLAILGGVIVGNDFRFIILTLISGLVAIYTARNVNQRSDLTRAGAIIAAVNAATLLSLSLLMGSFQGTQTMIKSIVMDIIMGMTGGLMSSILAIGILPFLENAFGLTTSIRLLELANPNNGALKRLLLETPGTYHHSIIVGNLAEAVAEEIGADPILARVGAYYHDIGKTSDPYYFIENQLGNENIHDSLEPEESTKIIISHTTKGVDIAEKFGLPVIIKDLIQQHHGTTKLAFFYHKAVERYGEANIKVEDFRYPGPKPQTKEAAILMLADSVEAAVRSIRQPSKEKIHDIIYKIVQDKIDDGQLDECPLTYKDVNKIKATLAKVLLGIFHQRIQYPKKEE